MTTTGASEAFRVTFGCENCGNEWDDTFPPRTVVRPSSAQMGRIVVNDKDCGQLLGGNCECCYVVGCPVCNMGGGVAVEDRHPVGGDEPDAYRERNLLALAFIRASSRVLEEHHALSDYARGWWDDDATADGWAVVWVEDPYHGQFGWHVPMELVPDWLDERDPEYDGYSTEDKYERLIEGWIDPDD